MKHWITKQITLILTYILHPCPSFSFEIFDYLPKSLIWGMFTNVVNIYAPIHSKFYVKFDGPPTISA